MAMSKTDTTKTEEAVAITREFDAPRDLVWRAWTEPERVMRWWGPKDYTAPVIEIDFRVGGKWLFCMRSPEGQDYWSTGVYREIAPQHRISCSDSFADEKGNVVPATHYGMGADIPLEGHITLVFDEHRGGTKLTLTYAGHPSGEMREMMVQGWNESFDKLAASLK